MDLLVLRMTDGLGSNKYKSVDYDRLQSTISEKRFGPIKNSMKVAKIEQASQLHKENTVLKQHQLIWQKEFLRLQHLRKMGALRLTYSEISALRFITRQMGVRTIVATTAVNNGQNLLDGIMEKPVG